MQHFEDNSNSPECDYVTIRPDKIIQCTGLKDENGKLIYEGDIVKSKNGIYYKVVWNEIACQLLFEDIESGLHRNYLSIGFFEVIGNIFENKELI